MEAYELMKQLAEPLGIVPILITVDYRDKDGNYFHQEMTTMVPPTVTINDTYQEITREVLDALESKHFTVYSIDHILDGLSYDEVQTLSNKDPAEGRKHIMTIYRDFRKEGSAVKYPSMSFGHPGK